MVDISFQICLLSSVALLCFMCRKDGVVSVSSFEVIFYESDVCFGVNLKHVCYDCR